MIKTVGLHHDHMCECGREYILYTNKCMRCDYGAIDDYNGQPHEFYLATNIETGKVDGEAEYEPYYDYEDGDLIDGWEWVKYVAVKVKEEL